MTLDQGEPRSWRLLETREPDRLTASAIWLDGKPSPGGMAARLTQAWHSVAGAPHGPVLVAVTAGAGPGQRMAAPDRARARDAMRLLIDGQPALAAQVAAAAR